MDVYGIHIPDKALTNFELSSYVSKLCIPNFSGVFMRDALPTKPYKNECGIVNFDTSHGPGSHWVAYYKKGKERIYFDSYGQSILDELNNYLKTKKEKENDEAVIFRNTDIVQSFNTKICGHLCLYVLKSLSLGKTFREILDYLTIKGAGIVWTNNMANELHKPVRKKLYEKICIRATG